VLRGGRGGKQHALHAPTRVTLLWDAVPAPSGEAASRSDSQGANSVTRMPFRKVRPQTLQVDKLIVSFRPIHYGLVLYITPTRATYTTYRAIHNMFALIVPEEEHDFYNFVTLRFPYPNIFLRCPYVLVECKDLVPRAHVMRDRSHRSQCTVHSSLWRKGISSDCPSLAYSCTQELPLRPCSHPRHGPGLCWLC
jgi:hypothetical protein